MVEVDGKAVLDSAAAVDSKVIVSMWVGRYSQEDFRITYEWTATFVVQKVG